MAFTTLTVVSHFLFLVLSPILSTAPPTARPSPSPSVIAVPTSLLSIQNEVTGSFPVSHTPYASLSDPYSPAAKDGQDPPRATPSASPAPLYVQPSSPSVPVCTLRRIDFEGGTAERCCMAKHACESRQCREAKLCAKGFETGHVCRIKECVRLFLVAPHRDWMLTNHDSAWES